MGAPGSAVLGGLVSTSSSLEVGGWVTWPVNASLGLNHSLLPWGVGFGRVTGVGGEGNASATLAGVSLASMKEKNWPALLILVIIALTVGGNILVILAVSLEKKLQNATNFFLRSLAVADMLVGILVMPISLINILYDYVWPLPSALCPLWIYLDVLFSTSSIMHLCAISLDRYVAIRNPIEHSRFNSRTKAMMKIAAVWTISIGISMPIPVIGLHNTDKVFVNGSCILNEERFVLIGSFVAFFIPLVIMVVTYCLTIQVLQRQETVFLYEGKTSSQQPLQPPPTPSNLQVPPKANFLLPQINIPLAPPTDTEAPPRSRQSSLGCLKGAEPTQLSASPSESISIVQSSEGASQLNSPAGRDPAGCHGRRGMMQAIKNERRASKVLGVVFFLFLVMWCPFFITNVAMVLCHGSCGALAELLNVFVWVGYISSGVNPLVYTLFNKTYRRAFSSYIRCRYQTAPNAGAACGVKPPGPPPHAVTPSLCGGHAAGKAGVDRNSNCRNGGGVAEGGGNGSAVMREAEPDDVTDDGTRTGYPGMFPEEEEEEAGLGGALRFGHAPLEHTSSV